MKISNLYSEEEVDFFSPNFLSGGTWVFNFNQPHDITYKIAV